MKPHTAKQEILLMMGTSFSSRLWCVKDENGNENNYSPAERLKEACWNGLITEMLPEICKRVTAKKKLFLWQVREANSFIGLDLGETPSETEKYYSINPYSFLQKQFLS